MPNIKKLKENIGQFAKEVIRVNITNPYILYTYLFRFEPPHPERGWGFLNFFSLNKVNLSIFQAIRVEPAV